MRRQPRATGADAPVDAEAAMEIATHFLGTRPRTRRELELRLRRGRVADGLIATTLSRLEKLGLVDDVAFARWWAEQRDRHAPRGRRMIEAELRQRGVPREVIAALRGEELAEPTLDVEGLPGSEEERVDAALARHLRGRPVPDDPGARQRLGAYLVRRGFAPEAARAAIRRASRQPEE
ncbi:MAG: RecX family transcriptional regulator [Chloroflexota bacterium]|nr:RecX family transcriptional regulator [Chloroflexota bacterium]